MGVLAMLADGCKLVNNGLELFRKKKPEALTPVVIPSLPPAVVAPTIVQQINVYQQNFYYTYVTNVYYVRCRRRRYRYR